ncbi:MAG: histidine kinase [Actinomycetaceae bacterium]|nr:histidine kinase [Actinomycetaceae bacterium]
MSAPRPRTLALNLRSLWHTLTSNPRAWLPTIGDTILALLLVVTSLQVAGLFTTPSQAVTYTLLQVISTLTVLWRSRQPYICVGILVTCILIHTIVIPFASFLLIFSALIALWTAAGRFDSPWRWPTVILGYILNTGGLAIFAQRTIVDITLNDIFRLYGWLWLSTTIVVLIADRRRAARSRIELTRERLAILESQRETLAELAVAQERARLAREIHDLLGHTLTVVTAQAEGARFILHSSPQRADEALATIARVGREGVDQVHQLVDLLGEGAMPAGRSAAVAQALTLVDSTAGTVGQQPSLAEASSSPIVVGEPFLDSLNKLATVSGARVRISEGPGPEGTLSEGILLVAREALTNAVRHGDGSGASVDFQTSAETWHLHIENPIAAQSGKTGQPPHRRGVGIASMRKRIEDMGGTFSAAPRGNNWHVNVEVPR